MAGEYDGKSKGKGRAKVGAKSAGKPPLYKAFFGGRAKVSSVQKRGQNSFNSRQFEKALQLVKRQHEPGLADMERESSLNRAMAMCQRHAIEMNDVLQEIEFRKNKYNGGFSTVIVRHRDNRKYQLIRRQTFLLDMVDAIESLYDCCAYTEIRKGVMRVTFYGICINPVTGQFAFKVAYNDAVLMGQHYKYAGPRNSYLLGVAAGLMDKAIYRKISIEKDIEHARELAATTFSTEDLEVEDEYTPDFDFDVGPLAGPAEQNANTGTGKEGDEDEHEHEDNEEKDLDWVRNMLVLADHRTKVEKAATEWLTEQGIKLRAARKGKKTIQCEHSFEEGKDDSNDLNLGEERLCGIPLEDIESRAIQEDEGEDSDPNPESD